MSMMTPANEWTFRQVVWATLVFAFIAISFWLLFRFSQVIFVFFIAIVIGTVIRPAVTWLYSHGLSRMVSLILIYFLLLALLVGFVLLVYPLIAEQSGIIAASLPDYYQNFRNWMTLSPNPMIMRISLFLPPTLPVLEPALHTGQEALASAEQILGYAVSVVKAISMLAAILLLSFHWTINGPRTIQSLILLLPVAQRERTRDLVSAMETKVSAFITGQAVLCLVIGVMALIAYLVIGLPNAFVLALVAGVLEAVPVVGPVLGAVPAGLIALSISPAKLIWIIVATIVIQQLENSLLVPRIMRRAVGVNPFVTLVALFAFSSLLGIPGALMAIPIAAILQLLLDRFLFNPETKEPEPSIGRDYTSRLRYETQDLIQDLRKQARLKKGGSALKARQIDQLMEEIEAIATDLDAQLAQDQTPGAS
jgi:predicted PurR-regulated permease PerM